jgi:hypothetical protein
MMKLKGFADTDMTKAFAPPGGLLSLTASPPGHISTLAFNSILMSSTADGEPWNQVMDHQVVHIAESMESRSVVNDLNIPKGKGQMGK